MYNGVDIKKSYVMELLPREFIQAISHTIGQIRADNAEDNLSSEDSEDETEEIVSAGNFCVVCLAPRKQPGSSCHVGM